MDIDLPLDAIISKENRELRNRRKYGGRTSRFERFSQDNKNLPDRWGGRNQSPRPETSNKILISNLNFAVNDADIFELFSDCGSIKKSMVNYDQSGHSHGTAEVIYYRREDAEIAIKKYNNCTLDGRKLKIEYVTLNKTTEKRSFNQNSYPRPQYRDRPYVRKYRPPFWRQNRKNVKQNQDAITKESLDAQLDAYKLAAESGPI